jgi:hypothetical protein
MARPSRFSPPGAVLLACLLCGVGASPAAAEKLAGRAVLVSPVQGAEAQPFLQGRFAGTTYETDAALQVSRDGKAITSAGRGSFIKANNLYCGKRRSIALVPPGQRVAVDSERRFSIRRQTRGFTLLAHGRFVSAHTARLVFRVRPARAFRCEPGPKVVRLHRKGAPPFSGCRSQPAKTLLQSDDARIFNQGSIFYGYYFRPVAYGCLFSTDKRFYLGMDDPASPIGDGDSSDARHFQLAGPYTAYVLHYLGAVIGSDEVSVVDLRDGSSVAPGWNGDRVITPGLGGPRIVRSLVLKDNGSVAWIQNDYYTHEEQLWAHDALGDHKLDSAPERDKSRPITALALTGSTLTWLHDGEPRSATLN